MTVAATDIFHELTEADPHSALGTTALAGVLAAKAAIERFSLPGTLFFFGEPAEKVCGSKPVHAAKGKPRLDLPSLIALQLQSYQRWSARNVPTPATRSDASEPL